MVTWNTDGKHCQDRFKLLVAKFRREDREKANASGGRETYGEFEQLAQDIVIEIDDFNAEKETARMELQGKEDALLAAGRNVREMAMSRSSSRWHDCGDANDEEEGSMDKRRKRRRISPRKTRQDMDRAILAVEKAEELRNKMAERQDVRDQEHLSLDMSRIVRDEKLLTLEKQRINNAPSAAEDRNEIEQRRVDLEESRLESERSKAEENNKRKREAAAERRLGMEGQRSMLELIRELRHKS
ncbi:hypothetical protein BWQ96_07016 [Gracilariopsis chorda]|uniref:Uncharacterized protein n=1 Tax=Gracilariopsis chorda TaxID=448386 RepID=A0A2V3IMD6_9FLOR|nr:hypothetical protein BWQ96_07016 [Gracilariopsis chorda]|eukprot:PXF43243.1 hypothetical protein BWQ96_07016 [Gracilariopsis chorda]